MKESSTYQAILEEGRAEGRAEGRVAEAREMLRILGARVFGPPDAQAAAAIEALDDSATLDVLRERLQSARNWQELLGQPAARQRRGHRRQTP